MKDRQGTTIARAMSSTEMVADVQKRGAEAVKYVKETGLCCACRKNPVAGSPDPLRCEACVDKTEQLLKGLKGSGFVELSEEGLRR